MFFTKEFVLDEISSIRKIVAEVCDESIVESPSMPGLITHTRNGERLQSALFKLDVIQNAISNVHTN